MCTFSQKIARSGAVHRRGNRWTDGPMLEGCPLCVARKWVPRRARGEGRARPPPLQHPTPPRRRRRPRPNSRNQRHPRSMTMAACARCPSFAFFAAISRPRGVMDRFSGFFPEEDDWATMADDCCDILVARRRAVGTDRALVCGTMRRRARRNARQIAR